MFKVYLEFRKIYFKEKSCLLNYLVEDLIYLGISCNFAIMEKNHTFFGKRIENPTFLSFKFRKVIVPQKNHFFFQRKVNIFERKKSAKNSHP